MNEFIWLRVSPTHWVRCAAVRRILFGGVVVVLLDGSECQAVNPRSVAGAMFFDEVKNG